MKIAIKCSWLGARNKPVREQKGHVIAAVQGEKHKKTASLVSHISLIKVDKRPLHTYKQISKDVQSLLAFD